MAHKITIEVTVPDSFDDPEDRWEIEQAAQETVNSLYAEEFEYEKEN